MKPGYKTTEFWLALLTALAGSLVSGGALPDDFPQEQLLGGIASLLAVISYVWSRTRVKVASSENGASRSVLPAKEDGGVEVLPPSV